jgi:hypothetical protein
MGGHLPLGTVLTAGANLTGFDGILQGLAQQAFATMLVCIIVGGAGGYAFAKHQSQKTTAVPSEPVKPSAAQATVSNGFCIKCGTAFPQGADFCAACGVKRSS